MAEINRAVKGTGDVLPSDSYKWQFVEGKMLETARLYGFNEIRIPVFEHTEVFRRSVGHSDEPLRHPDADFPNLADGGGLRLRGHGQVRA